MSATIHGIVVDEEAYIHSIDVQDSLRVGNESKVDDMCQRPHSITCQQCGPELVLQGLCDLI